MSVRTYALLADSVLAAVRAPIEAAVAAWRRDWGLPEAAVTCRRAWEGPGLQSCLSHLIAADAQAWLDWSDGMQAALQRAMFPPDRDYARPDTGAELAGAAGAAALEALAAGLGGAALGPQRRHGGDTAQPAALRAAGSGAVLVEVRIDRHAVRMMLDHAAVSRLAAAPETARPALPPADFHPLLAGQPVRLAVEAGRATVGLGSLTALAPGDVIRLDTLADQPLTASAADGTVLLRGYLGTRDHYLALDLAAGEAPSGEQA
jgi:flagellar motor switch/type III secretory pathway protein FliN